MNLRLVGILLLIALSGCGASHNRSTVPEPWYPSANERGDPIFAVFEGRIPCADPERTNCEKIKVALVLYHDGSLKTPTTYKLARIYVATSPEGSRLVVDGTWTIAQGTKLDPTAPVYQLDSRAPQEFRSYWVIGRDILFILDRDMSPRVGTAGWSYVLNRTH